jgi:hypothetical protein
MPRKCKDVYSNKEVLVNTPSSKTWQLAAPKKLNTVFLGHRYEA